MRLRADIGLRILEIDTDELNDPRYAANPSNRCYFCKTELWSRVVPAARERGIAVVADGTNADDLHRTPAGRAGCARAWASFLRSRCIEFSKAEIRERSRALGLPTWQQPSSPCLSSRIPYGTPVTVGRLKRVERAEAALRELGVMGDLRVRHFGSLARVELGPAAARPLVGRRSTSRCSRAAVQRRRLRARSSSIRAVSLRRVSIWCRSTAVRLFLAINLPEETKREIAAATEPLRETRARARLGPRAAPAPDHQVPRGAAAPIGWTAIRDRASPRSRPGIASSRWRWAASARSRTFGGPVSYGWGWRRSRGSSCCITTSRWRARRSASRWKAGRFARI